MSFKGGGVCHAKCYDCCNRTGAFLRGCAKRADKVAPSYVSPLVYDNFNCSQLAAEGARLSVTASKLAGAQDKQANNDAVAMGVGLILFWPSLLFIKGAKQNEAELAQVRGQMNALEQAAIAKKCGIQFNKETASTQGGRNAQKLFDGNHRQSVGTRNVSSDRAARAPAS